MPSPEEVEEHYRTHVPFRSWCPHCVKGQGQNAPHKKGEWEALGKALVSIDYMYMYREGNEPGEEEEKEKGTPTMVVNDEGT